MIADVFFGFFNSQKIFPAAVLQLRVLSFIKVAHAFVSEQPEMSET